MAEVVSEAEQQVPAEGKPRLLKWLIIILIIVVIAFAVYWFGFKG